MKTIKLISIILIFSILQKVNLAQEQRSASKFLGVSEGELSKKLKKNKKTSIKPENLTTKINLKKNSSVKEKKKAIKPILQITNEVKIENRNDSLIAFAKQFLGIKYRYGGMSPKTGFDCSGFVNYVFLHFGVKLPRSSKYFVNLEEKVEKQDCQKGDILVFAGRNPQTRPVGHVAIVSAIENDDIEFIHASARSKKGGIIITKLSESNYYQKRLVTIIRK